MKKVLLVLIGILAGVFLLLSFLDKSDYAIEKKLWRIQKQFDQIAQDPRVVPDQKFESVARSYLSVIKQHPRSPLVKKIYLQIGRVYGLKKDFAKARENFQAVFNKYADDKEVAAEALMNLGITYEGEMDEKQAIATYKKIIDSYPTTDIGLNMPLYIVNYYLRVSKVNESNVALREAVSFYKDICRDHPKSIIEFNALRLLVTAYFAQKDWSQGVNTLGEVLLKYPSGQYMNVDRANLIIKSINTVAVTQLKDYDVAINIYQKFMSQNPKHPLNKKLQDMINALQELKKQNVSIDQKQ